MITFTYGVVVGKYKAFPYNQIKFIEDLVTIGLDKAIKEKEINSEIEKRVQQEAELSAKKEAQKKEAELRARKEAQKKNDYKAQFKISKRISPKNNGEVIFDSSREVIKCPDKRENLGVLVSFGQSNSANSAEYLVKSEEVPDVINWYKGKCYQAKSPLLGATNIYGEWISLVGQKLVNKKVYDKVLIMSIGVGGSSIIAWQKGGVVYDRFVNRLTQLKKSYKITEMLWHQGETDVYWMGKDQYIKSFLSMENSIRDIGIDAPIFISIATYCWGNPDTFPNVIAEAQNEIPKIIKNTFQGVNTDKLLKPEHRHDNCHFNEAGQRLASTSAANIIIKNHKKF